MTKGMYMVSYYRTAEYLTQATAFALTAINQKANNAFRRMIRAADPERVVQTVADLF